MEDGWPVVAEPFLQWVVEDKFVKGRPAWEKACSGPNESVLFVDDVEPYELMKLRLLNSSHSAMAYVSLLACHTFVDEALTDIDVLTFLRAYMNEVVTTLVPVAGVNFIEYRAKLVERFSNPYIKDTLARLALEAAKIRLLGRALVEHFGLRGVQLRRACISLRGVPAVLCDALLMGLHHHPTCHADDPKKACWNL